MNEEVGLQIGMSNSQLEFACHKSLGGLSPWIYWTSEIYGLGKCLRAFAAYPRFLPLFVYSDHGPGLHSGLYPHELTNSASVHFTFHPLKAQRHQSRTDKKFIHIPHPWIPYRRSSEIRRSDNRQGTIVFLTHNVPGVRWDSTDDEEYFDSLRSLPDKYQPVVLCLHMHDIHSGFHKQLRLHGFPLVTAGNTSSADFVDKFYEMVRRFSYATSRSWGSQVAYCVEMGIPYFFLGSRPRLINLTHKEMPVGDVGYQDEQDQRYHAIADDLFRKPVDDVSQEQHAFVDEILGVSARTPRFLVSWILWRELFYSWRLWWPLWWKPITLAVRKRGVGSLLRRIFQRHP